MEYIIENFEKEEEVILKKYFTNINKPVFGLINLPEVVKGALFARYSRSRKSLRRLFLDEFYDKEFDGLEIDSFESERAVKLYDKMILEYGDDSVAQLGGAHIACEQVSNILAKFLEKGRLAGYLEQSTRYVIYDQKENGSYKYYIPKEISDDKIKSKYEQTMNGLFDSYSAIIEEIRPLLKVKFPKGDNLSQRAWNNIIKAKACDITRGLLPASTKTNLGIFGNGQFFEYLLIKMFASSNFEVQNYARMILDELRKIIPSFLTRVDRKDRGEVWSKYFFTVNKNMAAYSSELKLNNDEDRKSMNVNLIYWDKNPLDKIVANALYEYSNASLEDIRAYVDKMNKDERIKILKLYFGTRKNRRHKPGRALENIFYKFDIISDYGAFRDIQRHRMLTIEWQNLTPFLGYCIPDELVNHPQLLSEYKSKLEACRELYHELALNYGSEIAQYSMPLAFNIRYTINMNLREAFHLIELRTQKQGHSSYRRIAMEMANQIKEKAGHHFLIDSMSFIDFHDYEFSREESEKKYDQKLKLDK